METEPGVPRVFAAILTALIERPDRLVYVSSGMHRSIPPRMNDSPLDEARLERLVGLRGEQAVRCSARICGRPALEERPI